MPNSEAIAWYVEEARRLLKDQQRQAESLRSRAAEVAGFGAIFLALIGGNAAELLHHAHGNERTGIAVFLAAGTACLVASVAVAIFGVLRPKPYVAIAAGEIAWYLSDRFLNEPDLWRIHLRSLHSLEQATEAAERGYKGASSAMTVSLYTFIAGLGFTVLAIGTLVIGSI